MGPLWLERKNAADASRLPLAVSASMGPLWLERKNSLRRPAGDGPRQRFNGAALVGAEERGDVSPSCGWTS